MEGIQVSVEKVGLEDNVAIISVGGYIDTTTSSELERTLDSLLKEGVFQVVIDLEKVDYISSAGWGIFISEIKGIRERGGDLKLARMIPDVYEVFELLEFHYILKAYDTVDEALESFNIKQESVRSKGSGAQKSKNSRKEVQNSSLSVEEKIKKIVKENPSYNPQKITKELNTDTYGFESIEKAEIRKILKELNLGTKKQREEFSKSS
ncbi:MAG: STAS domain-containing protein [bacterium]